MIDVATATKFERKLGISWLVYQISPRSLQGVYGVLLLNDVRKILPRLAPVAMATKFDTK